MHTNQEKQETCNHCCNDATTALHDVVADGARSSLANRRLVSLERFACSEVFVRLLVHQLLPSSSHCFCSVRNNIVAANAAVEEYEEQMVALSFMQVLTSNRTSLAASAASSPGCQQSSLKTLPKLKTSPGDTCPSFEGMVEFQQSNHDG